MNASKKTFLIFFLISFLTFGIALILISLLPFNELKAVFDYFAPDGNFGGFSLKHIRKIRLAGILLCVIGGCIYILRNIIARSMPDFKIADFLINPAQLLRFIHDSFRELKEAVGKDDKTHYYAFLFLIVLAAAVRIYYLFHPFITDESRIFESRVYHAHGVKGILDLITGYYIIGDHMFQTLLSYIAFKLFGSEQSMWTYRLPPLIAGTMIVPAVYMVIRPLYNRHAALLAMGLTATMPYLIHYSVLARGYSMICLFFLLILALGIHLIKTNNVYGWHLFALLSALGFYTMPLMLYPYGVVVTWLLLNIFSKNIQHARSALIKNLLISVIITAFMTFLCYSPIIFFGTGIKSLYYYYTVMRVGTVNNYTEALWTSLKILWAIWNRHFPYIVMLIVSAGFFISLILHKKLSRHRINVIVATCMCFIPIMLITKVMFEHRHLSFMLPLSLGLASPGLLYLLKPAEKIFRNHASAMYSVFVLIVSIILIGNTVLFKPYHLFSDPERKRYFNGEGKFTDFAFIFESLRYHQLSELYGMSLFPGVYNRRLTSDIFGKPFPPENYMDLYSMPKTLILFDSQEENEFWMRGLNPMKRKPYGGFLNDDMEWYLSTYSRTCHSVFLISSASIHDLGGLLDKKGLPTSDYTQPELLHQYEYANLYKITRTNNCMDYNAMERKAINMVYTWKAYAFNFQERAGRFPGDSENDGIIGNTLKERTSTAPAPASTVYIFIPPRNPVSIGGYRFWVYAGYDSTNTNKNVLVICKTANCADEVKFTKGELELMEAVDTAFDGISDAGTGQFRASTGVSVVSDLPTVDGLHNLGVIEVTGIDETSAGSATDWDTSHNSAVWLFDKPF